MSVEPSEKIYRRTERYRARASSAANLTAAVTGAVAAGLVLNERTADSLPAVVLGTVSLGLLLAATVAWAISSQMHLRPRSSRVWLPRFRSTAASALPTSAPERAQRAFRRVVKATDVAAVLSLFGVAALVATFAVIVWVPKSIKVQVVLVKPIDSAVCPVGRTIVSGHIASRAVLTSNAPFLIKLTAGECRLQSTEVLLNPDQILTLRVRS